MFGPLGGSSAIFLPQPQVYKPAIILQGRPLLTVIELNVRAMDYGRSFIAIEQNPDRCAASTFLGERNYYTGANPDFGTP
jgi:hypothetical protein